jgi:hypothetical protein
MITLVYRNSGPWGTGKLSNLSASDFDNNNWTISQAIAAKQAQGVGIAEIYVDPITGKISFQLTDHTWWGPFALPPAPAWNPRGTWVPNTSYSDNDTVGVGAALYLVIWPHVSATTFDPNANDGAGHNLYQLIMQATPPAAVVQTRTGAAWTPQLSDANTYTRFTNAGGCGVTIPAHSSVAFPVGTVLTLRDATSSFVHIGWGGPVVVNVPQGFVPDSAYHGATMMLVNVGTDLWDLSGNLATSSP